MIFGHIKVLRNTPFFDRRKGPRLPKKTVNAEKTQETTRKELDALLNETQTLFLGVRETADELKRMGEGGD